jgi:beta-glucosidase
MGSMAEGDSYREFDVDFVLSQLTTDEKIALLSGSDPWHTAPVKRLNVPKIRLTDGPNGVRGTKFFNGVAAACLPCGEPFDDSGG